MDPIQKFGRREILIRFGRASAALTIAGVFSGQQPGVSSSRTGNPSFQAVRWLEPHPLPNGNAQIAPAPGTRPELTAPDSLFRMDLGSIPHAISEEKWRLRVSGLVERGTDLRLSDIRKLDPIHQYATLACITNPVGGGLIGTTRWTGVSLQRFLREVRARPDATHMKISAADGFYEIVSIETIRRDPRVMLAYEWDGVPLSMEHGFPLRIFIPDLYGMKQPKWIRSIELIRRKEKGYWGNRGWDDDARIRTMSVIDAPRSAAAKTEIDGQAMVQLGGIAFAGARGISRVQIQVDREPWRDADLRTPLSELSWVLWRYDWPRRSGTHSFAVRCVDGTGAPQITGQDPPFPSGATGLHRIELKL
jgi:DMSO/TMAO reductase YedYZ molybdopterin-dependent catalytic subunit